MTYALTTDGQTVTTTATLPPTGARRLDTGAWVTPPADGWTADLLAACGWLPVTEVPRPADTATHTSYPAPVVLVAGVPTQQWTVRPWTADELAAQADQAVASTLAADTKTDLDKIAKAIAKLATLLGDEATAGSVRALIGPAGAPAGTASLRAIRAKTAGDGTVVKLAATVDALAKLTIDLAQLVIDGDQAARRTARQVQRLALAATDTLTSADVGTDI